MPSALQLPGTALHQRVLRTVTSLYESSDLVLAVIVFGSLGQDTWDTYSDLDLAVVVQDGVQMNLADELERVRAALAKQGEQLLFAQVAGEDAYLLLQSLCGIAICYHPLRSMSTYVLEGWRVLCGALDAETIRKAAQANDRSRLTLGQQVHRALWLALSVDIAAQRRQFWRAVPSLERMRAALVTIFSASRGGSRVYQIFEEAAGVEMKTKLGQSFPQYFPDSPAGSLRSLGDALMALLDLVERDLAELSNNQVSLGSGEREFIARLRKRQETLHHDST
jgi:predicted nucleotidyltransferase